MATSVQLKAEYGALYQDAEHILASIDRMSKDLGEHGAVLGERDAAEAVNRLRADLQRLSQRMDQIKVAADKCAAQAPMEKIADSTPYLVGGVVLGVVLGKFLGSKSRVDSLPFWWGLEMAARLNPRE